MAVSRNGFECIVVLPGEGRAGRGAGGAETIIKMDGSENSGSLAVFEQVSPPGSGPPLHIHKECSEALYIIEGAVELQLGSEIVKGPAGTFVFVPSGTPHTYTSVGPHDARILFWFVPAARMAEYFAELATIEPDLMDPHRLEEVARRNGVEIVRSRE